VGETFCRGIQDVNTAGEASFTTIYPGWYSGRITHSHFQIYLNSSGTATATSQMAFPQEITTAVYNSALYTSKGQNTSVTSFAADNVFSDRREYQMATISGDLENGYIATLTVGVAL
jgi:protocatechuate 3,4-dioxygenase beta subunit